MSHESSARVKLYLAGAFFLTLNDEPIQSFHSNKTKALLAYLVLEARKPLAREKVANIFWEGYTRQSARTSLRVALYDLRQLMGAHSDLIVATRNTVQFRSDHRDFWCDILQVEQSANATSGGDSEMDIDKFDRLFLAGFEEIDSPAFLDWLEQRREQFAALIERLSLQSLELVGRQHNLPRLLMRLFGRKAEIAWLKKLLLDPHTPLITLIGAGGVGKTTLALAAARQLTNQFSDGAWLVPLDTLVPPATSDPSQAVLQAIAHTLHVIPQRNQPLKIQVINYLQQQRILLILDNFEHVQAAAPLLLELLEASDELTILVTSRQRLNLLPERRIFVQGLPVPAAAERDSASVRLFCDRLQSVAGHINFERDEWEAVGAICRLLNGLPLGIELAAVACEQTTPSALLAHIEANFTVLETDMLSFPERQRNLWSVMQYTWQILCEEEQRTLLQCAALQGQFSADAIAAITQAPTTTIQALRQYGLLTPVQDDLLTMHAQLRAFCQEQWGETHAINGWLYQAQQRQAVYYLNWLADQLPELIAHPSESCAKIQRQLDNIEQAWQWAIRFQAVDLLITSCHVVGQLFNRLGKVDTGIRWLQAALDSAALHHAATTQVVEYGARQRFIDPIEETNISEQLIIQLRLELASLKIVTAAPVQDVDPVLLSFTQLSDADRARRNLIVGTAYLQQLDYENAVVRLEQAFAYYAVVGDQTTCLRDLAIQAAYQLGQCYTVRRRHDDASAVWQRATAWSEANEDKQRKAEILLATAKLASSRGAYQQALTVCEQALLLDEMQFTIDLHYFAGVSALRLGAYNIAKGHMHALIKRARRQQLVGRDYGATIHEIEGLLVLCEAQLVGNNLQAAQHSINSALSNIRRIGCNDLRAAAHQLREKVQAQIETAGMPAQKRVALGL